MKSLEGRSSTIAFLAHHTSEAIEKAIGLTETFDTCIGNVTNLDKSAAMATKAKMRKRLGKLLPTPNVARYLGQQSQLTRSRLAPLAIKSLEKYCDALKRIDILPVPRKRKNS